MKLFFLLILLQIPLSYAQTFTEEQQGDRQEEMYPLDEHTISELAMEAERQEDVLHPEGEVNDWSLGSEDLPAEDYQ